MFRIPCLLLITAACSLQGAINVSLTTDFSSVNNPNGEWTYVNGTEAGGLVTINTSRTEVTTGFIGGWSEAENFSGSVVEVLGVPTGGWKDGEVGDVLVHSSGTSGTTTGVVWTSSEAGVVNITGRAWDAFHEAGRDSNWKLYLNDTVIAERASVFDVVRGGANAAFGNNIVGGASLASISIGIGDTVSFLTEATTPLGHFTGVELNISQVPEPASFALVLGSLALLVGARRRRGH